MSDSIKWSCDFKLVIRSKGNANLWWPLTWNFYCHRHCGNGDIMFLVCHVATPDHIFKESCDLMNGSTLSWVTTVLSLVAREIAFEEI